MRAVRVAVTSPLGILRANGERESARSTSPANCQQYSAKTKGNKTVASHQAQFARADSLTHALTWPPSHARAFCHSLTHSPLLAMLSLSPPGYHQQASSGMSPASAPESRLSSHPRVLLLLTETPRAMAARPHARTLSQTHPSAPLV